MLPKLPLSLLLLLQCCTTSAFTSTAAVRHKSAVTPQLSRRLPLASAKPALCSPLCVKCTDSFRQPPVMMKAAEEWDDAFRRRRLGIFIFTVIAYAAYYLVRNSIYYTAPAMVAARAP